ncbi:hypothetical protein [Thiothrix unzii]|jgi:hypothetical protein|uniref:hypothetical protein n=1 Tax=Thiothrix unzii TaxID=111769 RepID=UPI002A360457|nr:hypothetical protein [Thiothrix unzii]MDX9988676.1 hypothetical protein [Thiothrix unzii]
MKNQYFGDINDYKKYGLLRAIKKASNLQQLVAWMLTPDDGGSDGKFVEYLTEPSKWEKHDPLLYSELIRLVGKGRNVSLIEESNILNECAFFSDIVPDSSANRKEWFSNLLTASTHTDLVFLDPDNGIEIKSKPYGRKDSSKFLYWHEIKELWKSGKSLLIYQHFIREKRETYIQRILQAVQQETTNSTIHAFATPRVLFILALQPRHQMHQDAIIKAITNSWGDQIKHWKLIH